MISNARMYAVTPVVEAAWQVLIGHVADEAGLGFDYLPYPAPQPLETLWRRPDVGCVQMCGFPIALGLADVQPVAAPIPDAAWAGGLPVYRTDLIVRADSPARSLRDTFEGTLGWTVAHSHSGFNALRHHLLPYRTPETPHPFAHVSEPLVTARAVLDAVLAGTVTVGPLDAYWHLLIRDHAPALLAGVRVLESTARAPMPAFVMAAGRPAAERDRLAAAFAAAAGRPWFPPLARSLRLSGFAPMRLHDYATTLAWDADAKSRGCGDTVA